MIFKERRQSFTLASYKTKEKQRNCARKQNKTKIKMSITNNKKNRRRYCIDSADHYFPALLN
jgi:hypothetical protein